MISALALRRTQGRLLARPSARTIRWVAFAMIATAAALIVWTGGRKGGDPATIALPVATTLLCIWLCFLFEDLTAETSDATATPLVLRRGVRAAIAVPAIFAVWFALTWIDPLDGPTIVLVGSFAAETLLSLATAALAVRLAGPAHHGLLAAGGVVFLTLVLPVASGDPPAVDPSMPPVGTPLTYWSGIAIVSVVVLLWAHLARRRR